MSDKQAIIVTGEDNLRLAARKIIARLKKNEGNITTNGVLAELAQAIGGGRQNWGGITRHSVFASSGIRLTSAMDNMHRTERPETSIAHEAHEHIFQRFVPAEKTSKSRMLDLAALCRSGKYEETHSKDVVCQFLGVDLFEFELICIADLINAIECSQPLIYRDSAYYLLREWGHSSTGINRTYPTGFIKFHICKMIFDISYAVPISASKQMDQILETWACLKFESSGHDCAEKWQHLAFELGWMEGEDADAV